MKVISRNICKHRNQVSSKKHKTNVYEIYFQKLFSENHFKKVPKEILRPYLGIVF